MASTLPQYSVIMGTHSMLGALCHKRDGQINEIPDHLIIFGNGILDLTTGQLGPHDASHFTTNMLPYEYQPTAQAANWMVFLNDIFQYDQERIALLQEWFGYIMSNSYDHHKIMLLLGAPRSGKGTIGRIMEQIVGPANYTGASLHAFTSDPFINSLRTKAVAFSGDTERRVARHQIDVVIERLKKISGNDAVTFSRKFKDTLSQALPTRIVLAGNHVPALFDDSGALSGRLLVLPFDVCYAGREDLGLQRRLMQELSGIAAWALEGLRRLSAQGKFTEPAASVAEAIFIEEAFSPLVTFIREVCVIDASPEAVTFCDELYDAYRAWAVIHTESHIMPRRTFISAFKDTTRGRGCAYGSQRRDGQVQRGFSGLTVAQDSVTTEAFKPTAVRSV
jgi:putative DNA primase/helicase